MYIVPKLVLEFVPRYHLVVDVTYQNILLTVVMTFQLLTEILQPFVSFVSYEDCWHFFFLSLDFVMKKSC